MIRSIVSSEACKINQKVIGRLCEESLDKSYGKAKQCIKEYESVYQETLEVKGKTEVTELRLTVMEGMSCAKNDPYTIIYQN